MKPRFAFAFAFWMNLDVGSAYLLTQNIDLSGYHGEKIEIEKDTPYGLVEVTPLDGLSVVQYVFAAEICKEPKQVSEMELILPEENDPGAKSEVGVQLVPECRLEIFIESKDLGRSSFYRAP